MNDYPVNQELTDKNEVCTTVLWMHVTSLIIKIFWFFKKENDAYKCQGDLGNK